LHESYVVGPEDFVLEIYNHGEGKEDNKATNVHLIVAVKDLDDLTAVTVHGMTIVPGAFVYGSPVYPSGRQIPSHGVFPTWYTEVEIGDIPEGETVEVPVYVEGTEEVMVHFDAYGLGTAKGKGKDKNAVSSYDVHNPFSHDVTIVGGNAEPPQCDYIKIVAAPGELAGEFWFEKTAISNTGNDQQVEIDITYR